MNNLIIFLTSCAFVFIAILTTSSSGGRALIGGQGNTGAPCDDFRVCGDCHLGGSYGMTTEQITIIDPVINRPVQSYLPGKEYEVVVDVIKAQGGFSRYGFQATVIGPDTMDIGSWLSVDPGMHIQTITNSCSNQQTYIEHSQPSTSSKFKARWKAPSSTTDTATFYFVGNVVNGTGGTSGDNGGFGNTMKLPPVQTQHLVLNSTDIPGQAYYALDSISVQNKFASNSLIYLTSKEVILDSAAQVDLGSLLEVHILSGTE